MRNYEIALKAKSMRSELEQYIRDNFDWRKADSELFKINFSHVFRHHLNASSDNMRQRIYKYHLKAASTFFGTKETVSDLICKCLLEHIDEICEYCADDTIQSYLVLDAKIEFPVKGFGCRSYNGEAKLMNKFVIVLGKDDIVGPFYLRNAYPYAEYEDIKNLKR